MISQTEENYLKAIFKITEREGKSASTNAIAAEMNTAAASVTDMIKRLSAKDYLNYEKSKGVTLSTEGERMAKQLIRKHRIWEVFLCEKLGYTWDECHDLSEQLEHIQSPDLISRMDDFLGHPKFDPHGDPIPDSEGNFTPRKQMLLSEMKENDMGVVVGVQEHSAPFLRFLNKQELTLGATIKIIEIFEFDDSIKILLNKKMELTVSNKVSQNLFLKKTD
jgi:DtxR family transcriptional regulator, Mn-dependent transcriptional regulator